LWKKASKIRVAGQLQPMKRGTLVCVPKIELDGRFHPDIAAEARSKMLFPGLAFYLPQQGVSNGFSF
jgi:hypothetical protein|tara:strand:+ start:133 stop:333 length:201 start_codon:yes stop_codon:yes gene_type:complete